MVRIAQDTMQAVVIDRFGGPETLAVRTMPVPEVGPDDIMIRVECAGVGVWDPFERAGGFAAMSGGAPRFPHVLGSDGAGTVVAVGENVSRFQDGDRAYVFTFLNPMGGCYAEYAVVRAEHASPVPDGLSTEQAGAMPVCAMTALRGLDDTLGLKRDESLLVFGASGGVGHLAVQLAERMGARVLAVASGADGVELCRRIGADVVVDGHGDDVLAAARDLAPGGVDAALLAAGGPGAERALAAMRDGGRVAYPNGVEPAPRVRSDLTARSYDGMPDRAAIAKLDRLVARGPLTVHIGGRFPLRQVADAHRALDGHFLGKLVLKPTGDAGW